MGSHNPVLPTNAGADEVSHVIVRLLGPQASRILSLLLRYQCEHSSHLPTAMTAAGALTPPHLALAYLQ